MIAETMNDAMTSLLAGSPMPSKRSLAPGLRVLLDARLVSISGAIALKPFVNATTEPPIPSDLTGWEAFVNKIVVSFYVHSDLEPRSRAKLDELFQGVEFGRALAQRLEREGGDWRVVLSRDPAVGDVT